MQAESGSRDAEKWTLMHDDCCSEHLRAACRSGHASDDVWMTSTDKVVGVP